MQSLHDSKVGQLAGEPVVEVGNVISSFHLICRFDYLPEYMRCGSGIREGSLSVLNCSCK